MGLLKAHRGKAGFAALPVDSPYRPVSTDVLFQHSEAVVVTAQGETFVDALIVTNGPIDSIVELGVTLQSVVGRVVSARMALVCGDQNGDGVLTSSMPRSSLASMMASFFQRVLSDLNGNGEIEILDLIQLLQFIVGEIDRLQCRDFQALLAP